MSNLLDLSGKIALVTGSSRGIGKELALELAEGGAKVAIHYLKSEELAEKTVEEIKLKGVEVGRGVVAVWVLRILDAVAFCRNSKAKCSSSRR